MEYESYWILPVEKDNVEFSLHQGNFISFGQLIAVLRVTSGGSSPQGVPGVGKKADAVTDWNGTRLLYIFACLH